MFRMLLQRAPQLTPMLGKQPQRNMALMRGLTVSSIKEHSCLVPLYFFMGVATVLAVGYSARMLFKGHDVCIVKKSEGAPWNKIGANEQYKFLNHNVDYENLPKRPTF